MFPYRHIHIVGASGSGTTTLGASLAAAIDGIHIDTDDHYWLPTWPPYREKRPPAQRIERLKSTFAGAERWVLSGSLLHWGAELAAEFDLVIFLVVPPAERMGRTLAREQARYGDRIAPGGAGVSVVEIRHLSEVDAFPCRRRAVHAVATKSPIFRQIINAIHHLVVSLARH